MTTSKNLRTRLIHHSWTIFIYICFIICGLSSNPYILMWSFSKPIILSTILPLSSDYLTRLCNIKSLLWASNRIAIPGTSVVCIACPECGLLHNQLIIFVIMCTLCIFNNDRWKHINRQCIIYIISKFPR